MRDSVISGVVGTLIAAAVLALITVLWRNRRRPGRALREQASDFKKVQLEDARDKLTVLREQVVHVARMTNVVLPVKATGRSPRTVTYSDGTVSRFYPDFAAYQRAMRSGRVNPRRTFQSSAPVPVEEWDEARLLGWLAQNSDEPAAGGT